MATLLRAADYAARQSDRWLMVALLCLGIACAIYSHRRMLTHIDGLNRQARDDAHAYAEALSKFVDKSNELIPLWTTRLAENTKAIETNTALIKEFSHILRQKRRASDRPERRVLTPA